MVGDCAYFFNDGLIVAYWAKLCVFVAMFDNCLTKKSVWQQRLMR
nr:MAG TPA_asm: hypothetical protein [Caudoviricetes sp.]